MFLTFVPCLITPPDPFGFRSLMTVTVSPSWSRLPAASESMREQAYALSQLVSTFRFEEGAAGTAAQAPVPARGAQALRLAA